MAAKQKRGKSFFPELADEKGDDDSSSSSSEGEAPSPDEIFDASNIVDSLEISHKRWAKLAAEGKRHEPQPTRFRPQRDKNEGKKDALHVASTAK